MNVETDSRKIIQRLLAEGWIEKSIKGSHHKFVAPDGRIVVVPHPKKDLPPGTARSIAKSTGWIK